MTIKSLIFYAKRRALLWRRKRDLNPRYGIPYYTLSRGAPSASWVFLQTVMRKIFNRLTILPYAVFLVKHFAKFSQITSSEGLTQANRTAEEKRLPTNLPVENAPRNGHSAAACEHNAAAAIKKQHRPQRADVQNYLGINNVMRHYSITPAMEDTPNFPHYYNIFCHY